MGKDSKSRILLVDDHPVLRMGIAELINSEGTLEVCGEATNLAEAYQMVLKLKPDLVIADISLEGNSGIELMKELAYRWEGLPVLAYSMHDEQVYAERALRAGARGYVMKQHPPEILLEAISQVLAGRIYLSKNVSDRLLGKFVGSKPPGQLMESPIDRLSDRELEVLQLIAQGLSNHEIDERLFLALSTVKGHNRNIFDKLQVKSRTEAVARAHELGLV